MSGEDERDEVLLRGLRGVIEQEAEEDERWWTAVEQGSREGLPRDAPDLEVLRPLDENEHDAMTGLLLNPAEAKAEVETHRSRRRLRIAAAGVALMAAGVATAVLWVTAEPSLAPYRMEVSGGEKVFRGETQPAASRFTGGSVLSVVFRPERPSDDAPELLTVLVPTKETPRRVDPQIERASGGALRATMIIDRDWQLTAGPHRIVFILTPQGGLQHKGPLQGLVDRPPAGAQRFEYAFDYVPAI